MSRLKKNIDNLIGVAKSICDVNFASGFNFYSDFDVIDNSVKLVSPGRNSVGRSVLRDIPTNFRWSVTFDNDGLTLRIWI